MYRVISNGFLSIFQNKSVAEEHSGEEAAVVESGFLNLNQVLHHCLGTITNALGMLSHIKLDC